MITIDNLSEYPQDALQNSLIIKAALNRASKRGCKIIVTDGVFYLMETIHITNHCTTFMGECCGHPYPGRAATEFIFPADVVGIFVDGRPENFGERGRVGGFCLTSTKGTDPNAHGVIVDGARTHVVDLSVNGFTGNGIHMVEFAGPTGATANLSCIEHVTARVCGGSGFLTRGNNSNLVEFLDCSAEQNKKKGFWELETLGCNYYSCHTSGNVDEPYLIESAKTQSTLIGCYSEANQIPSWLAQRNVSLGGAHGAGWDMRPRNGVQPGTHIASDTYGLQIPQIEALLLDGLAKPTIPGTHGQFIPKIPMVGGQFLGWLCLKPFPNRSGFWKMQVR